MILYLPGLGKHNKEELNNIVNTLRLYGYEVLAHEWSHWSDESKKVSAINDLELIESKITGKKVDIVIAKSIGTFVASNLIWAKIINPTKIIFLGIPLNDLNEEDKELMNLVLQKIKDKLTLIHNTNDPHGSLEQLNIFLGNIEPQIISKEGDSHGYDYPQEILNILSK